ncbi:MAG: transferase hexapeptide repeat containing protein [Nostoc sp.]|uniref:transferase hexapeptide repeat containing protein n=1 Tax=unclassified Nostoc TaxID=2593658 RepID=UPI001D71C328|nr:transferase hexapeptide repeat containing protein [Nostoc sp. JL34]MBN3884716.1 transferase hexapeptide repeat containing protein [Nostoc sp. JL34]
MLDEANFEQRLATLEQTVADIKHQVIDAPTYSNWLEKVIGSISDEPAFLEALEYGRSLRHADILTEEAGEQLSTFTV